MLTEYALAAAARLYKEQAELAHDIVIPQLSCLSASIASAASKIVLPSHIYHVPTSLISFASDRCQTN